MTSSAPTKAIVIRRYAESDADQVRDLFRTVNRLLAPPDLASVFERYIEQSLTDEMARIPEYYAEHEGSFWVAEQDGAIVGMYGLERRSETSIELRRMYVDPACRRQGIARRLLHSAEENCRAHGFTTLELSTSELQQAALNFYRNAGYRLIKDEVAAQATNKTIGGGVRRYYFEKDL